MSDEYVWPHSAHWDEEFRDGLSIAEMAHGVTVGLYCQDCFCQFTAEHGEPVSCNHCVNQRDELDVKEVVVRARHPEANREGHANLARQRKARNK